MLVDPVPTKSVGLADIHRAPPGSDASAMAVAKLILESGAEDRAFLANHAEGVEEYLAILAGFSVWKT